jgi:hypothetical protein
MKKSLAIALTAILSACADTKYPGWQSVNIYETLPADKECESLHASDSNHSGDYTEWFKKRATRHKANSVVIEFDDHSKTGSYYNCHNQRKKISFSDTEYNEGKNTVTGQAFLTQKGGAVVTCAGQTVTLTPNNPYFNADEALYIKEPSAKAESLTFTSQCDAQGNFEFENIPNGEWIITTGVTWSVPSYMYLGGGYSTYIETPQGGILKKTVTIKPNQKNRFLISH